MRCALIDAAGSPLRIAERSEPVPRSGQVLVRIDACGVCRTDLHELDGDLPLRRTPIIPGHQIVGTIVRVSDEADGRAAGDRVGVAWLGAACGRCPYCSSGRENLCPEARFTGYDRDGGYAEACVVDARFCHPLPDGLDPIAAAPLLCAGAIGLRALRLCGDPGRLGLYGFGSSAHLVAQVARHEGRSVYAFTRADDASAQRLARELGASWAGGSDATPPEQLDAAIIFAPVGGLVPHALRAVAPGGVVVCAGIHMSDIPAMPYALLCGERTLRSVANLCRSDVAEILAIADRMRLRPTTTTFPLSRASEAVAALRGGAIVGSVVLTMRS